MSRRRNTIGLTLSFSRTLVLGRLRLNAGFKIRIIASFQVARVGNYYPVEPFRSLIATDFVIDKDPIWAYEAQASLATINAYFRAVFVRDHLHLQKSS